MTDHIEKLSVDILDEDYVAIFQSLNFLQRVMGFMRVEIKDRFATSPSKLYSIYCLVFWLFTIASVVTYYFSCVVNENSLIRGTYYKIGVLFQQFVIVMNVYNDHFAKGEEYVFFFIKLQKLDRDLKMKNEKIINKRVAKLVTACIGINITFFLIWSFFCITDIFDSFCLAALVIIFPPLGNYLQMIYISLIIYFIAIRVEYVNKELKVMLDRRQETQLGVYKNIKLNHFALSLERLWAPMLRGIHDIVVTIADFINLFQYTIFWYTCQVNLWNMITIQSLIEKFKYQFPVALRPTFWTCLLFLYTIALLVILSCLAENLTAKLNTTRKLCITLQSSHFDNEIQENASRMFLLLDVKCDISIYGIYALDFRLLLRLLAIAAMYTIVLLQFAML